MQNAGNATDQGSNHHPLDNVGSNAGAGELVTIEVAMETDGRVTERIEEKITMGHLLDMSCTSKDTFSPILVNAHQ